jgi:hypothetical protein
MRIIFMLLISIATSTFGMEEGEQWEPEGLWQPKLWTVGPVDNASRKGTLNTIFKELTGVQQKINNYAHFIPVEKREKIEKLLADNIDTVYSHYNLMDPNGGFNKQENNVDDFISLYQKSEPTIANAVNEIEMIIHNAMAQDPTGLSNALSSLSMNTDPLDDLIAGLGSMGLDDNTNSNN